MNIHANRYENTTHVPCTRIHFLKWKQTNELFLLAHHLMNCSTLKCVPHHYHQMCNQDRAISLCSFVFVLKKHMHAHTRMHTQPCSMCCEWTPRKWKKHLVACGDYLLFHLAACVSWQDGRHYENTLGVTAEWPLCFAFFCCVNTVMVSLADNYWSNVGLFCRLTQTPAGPVTSVCVCVWVHVCVYLDCNHTWHLL